MNGCKVVDIRKHTGYFGKSGPQDWADEWRAWVNENCTAIEQALWRRDLGEVMQGVGRLAYYTRKSWRSEDEFQAHWDRERNALIAVGAPEELAFVIYWAQHKDSMIWMVYNNIFWYGAELYIKDLYDKGLKMSQIDAATFAWRPFDCELTGRLQRRGVGFESISQATGMRLEMMRDGRLWRPNGIAPAPRPEDEKVTTVKDAP